MPLGRPLMRWLLGEGADPSVRYRVLRDVLDRPDSDARVAAARAQIGRVGWARAILDQQLPAGQWDTPGTSPRDLYVPKYIATNWRLLVLSDLGAPADDRRVRRAVDLFLRRFGGPAGGLGTRGSEVCFTGNAARMLARFGRMDDRRVHRAFDWLVRAQKPDGGWHCFPSRVGTLDCWEALAAFAVLPPARRSPAVARAVERGADFYLSRGLLREGRGLYRPWLRLHYPVHYYYDLLVGLDTLTALGYGDDRRLRAPLDRLVSMRRSDGIWTLDAHHPDCEDPNYSVRSPFYPFGLEPAGRPSRWITATVLRVLHRARRL